MQLIMEKILIVLIFTTTFCFSQISNDTLYLKFEKSMITTNSKNDVNEIEVKLSFTIVSFGNGRPTTYNFLVNNINKDFQYLKFEELKDKVPLNMLRRIKTISLNDLSEFSACDLYLLLADTKHIFLIKEENNASYIYELKYFSTQRGWEYARTD